MQSDDLPVDFYKEFDALVKHATKGAAKRKQSSVAELDENERERIVDAIVSDSAELVRAHTDDAGFSFELGTNVVLARA